MASENLFGIELGNYDESMDEYKDFEKYFLNELKDGASWIGKPVLGDVYSFDFEEDDGSKKTINKVNLDIINESNEEYLNIGLNLKKESDIQENIRKGSTLYDFIISMMEIETPNIADEYNLIEKIDLSTVREFLKNKDEIKIKVIEKDFKGREYNSFKVVTLI